MHSAASQTPPSQWGFPTIPQVARLPKLEIEPFDGTPWPNSYTLFNSLIHENASLSKAEKLIYLRSLLKVSQYFAPPK